MVICLGDVRDVENEEEEDAKEEIEEEGVVGKVCITLRMLCLVPVCRRGTR